MADSAIQFLVSSIGSLVEKEAALIGGVKNEMKDIKLELETMRSFLKVADRSRDANETEKTWTEQVRDVSYRAEDIIEEFLYHMGSIKREGGLKALAFRFIFLPKELAVKHQTAAKLKRIKSDITEIADRSKRYNLREDNSSEEESLGSAINPSSLKNLRVSSSLMRDDEFVGFEVEKESILNLLNNGEMERTVISVVGMAGLGKTALVGRVFSDYRVKRQFDYYAWVFVSKKYEMGDLLKKTIVEFFNRKKELVPSGLSNMVYEDLVQTLQELLRDKRYVLVLDDVWDDKLWSQINFALPEDKNGSRIILTTRNVDVATVLDSVTSHKFDFKPLENNDAWTLFCKKAFRNEPNNSCPPELEDIASSLVEKCGGLPIAIVAMGGLMASKVKSEFNWRKSAFKCLNWGLNNNSHLDQVRDILFLSFQDLPHHLKSCFMYCCLFPVWIATGRLVRLWIAEGFVDTKPSLTPEEVAESYIEELVSRNLLQVVKIYASIMRSKRYKLHTLMHEIAVSESERDSFCKIFDSQGMKEEERLRRMSFHSVHNMPQLSGVGSQQVRSFLAFNFDKSTPFPLDNLLIGFRLLRVLDLKDSRLEYLPTSIGKLFNLRYLNLKRTQIKSLPKSFKGLRNLLTLDVRRTKLQALPKGIVRLHKLRHILADSSVVTESEKFIYSRGMQVPTEIWKLKNLQVLKVVEANSELLTKIRYMSELRRLDLTKVKENDGPVLCSAIEKLEHLHRLLVTANSEEEILRMDDLRSPPRDLETLTLVGKLNSVPLWFHSLYNLVYLHLHWSRLMVDPLPPLSALGSLEHLILVNALDESKKKLLFNEGFNNLRHFSVNLFLELVEMTIADGVMPKLAILILHNCPKLRNVPQGIEHLANLGELDLKNISTELVESIRGADSIDHPRVDHIPVINHCYKNSTGQYKYESLSCEGKERVYEGLWGEGDQNCA